MNTRIRIVAIVLVVLLLGGGAYYFMTAGRESTEDAQVDAHVTPIAALVGGTVAKVSVADNQQVEATLARITLNEELETLRGNVADMEGRLEVLDMVIMGASRLDTASL